MSYFFRFVRISISLSIKIFLSMKYFLTLIYTISLIAALPSMTQAQDTHLPTPVCYPGLSVSSSPGVPVELLASLFNLSSFDDVTPADKLKFYFEGGQEVASFMTEKPNEFFEVVLYVEDEAGNKDACHTFFILNTDVKTQIIDTADIIPPTPVLHNVVSLAMPDPGQFILYASQLNAGSFDNITPKNALRFTFGPDPATTTYPINCFDRGGQEIEIFVWDQAGNFASCKTWININDPVQACPDLPVDSLPPVAVLKAPLEVEIGPSLSTEYIYPSAFDDGSYDDLSGIRSLLFKDPVYSYRFGCEETGSYPVTLLLADKVGNETEATSEIVVTDPHNYCSLSSKRPITQSLRIMPNPTGGELSWSSDNVPGRFVLYDMHGRQVLTISKNKPNGTMSISHLPAGIYLLVETDQNYMVKRQLISKI